MREHIYVEYLYPSGERSDFVPAIYSRLADGGVSFVGDVDHESEESFLFERATLEGDVGIWVLFEEPRATGAFRWPRIEVRCSIANFVDSPREPDAPTNRALVDAAREIYLATEIRPALVYGDAAVQEAPALPLPDDDLTSGRPYLTWLDIYTPEEVEEFGREKLLSAPAARVEELDDGGILVLSKHPMDEDMEPLESVAEHVGIPDWMTFVYSRRSERAVSKVTTCGRFAAPPVRPGGRLNGDGPRGGRGS